MNMEKVKPNPLAIPTWMSDAPMGTETMQEYVILPRLKVIQKQASPELLQKFEIGDVIAAPMNLMIAPVLKDSKGKPKEMGESFLFVPLFFFPEACTWNPLDLRGREPGIIDRSLDRNSPIFAKARDPQLRKEPHPKYPDKFIRHVEHLNYIVLLLGKPGMDSQLLTMTFSRGEHSVGRRFSSVVSMRRAPLYGCVFEARSQHRQNNQGDWYGIDVDNPSEHSPWVDKDRFEMLKAIHLDLADKHAKSLIRVQHEEAEVDAEEVTDTGKF